jgi:hypothetical protein
MQINKNNYEAFFLDYHEGNLTAEQVAVLLLFVEQHPELKEEFENFENIFLDDFSIPVFDNKALLIKEITPVNKEDYFIGKVESCLNTSDEALLNDFLKQHPAAISELQLFYKTKLQADTSISFENKDSLKKSLTEASIAGTLVQPVWSYKEDLLIASVENILSEKEAKELNRELTVDHQLGKLLAEYKKIKLEPDINIVFENKEELKRKSRKVISFYYYAAAVAASLLLVAGLFFIYKTIPIHNSTDFAEDNAKVTQPSKVFTAKEKEMAKINTDQQAMPLRLRKVPVRKKAKTTPTNNEEKVGADNTQIASAYKTDNTTTDNTTITSIQQVQSIDIHKEFVNQDASFEKGENNQINKITSRNQSVKPVEFVLLHELVTEKIKEKLLDENSVEEQKKNGHLKKMNGWDIAQLVTKGISKLSGRKLEVKPSYNNEGDVTSYALIAGEFKMSKGR